MHKLGLGLGLNMIRSLSTQAQRDANAYAALLLANGGTDIAANGQLANLVNFATALYALAGRVDFWPLRSSQNMGTGATAYSFHGVSGALLGTAAWHANGIYGTTGSGGGLVITSYAPILSQNPVSAFGVHSFAGTLWAGDYTNTFWLWGNQYGVTTNQSSGGFLRAATGVGVLNQMRGVTEFAASFTDNVFSMWSNTTTAAGSSNSKTYKNGGSEHIATIPTTVTPAASGASSYQVGVVGGTTVAGYTPFHLVAPLALSLADHAAIYAAYKANLGSGLSLP